LDQFKKTMELWSSHADHKKGSKTDADDTYHLHNKQYKGNKNIDTNILKKIVNEFFVNYWLLYRSKPLVFPRDSKGVSGGTYYEEMYL
jgi:hypothetical protein